MSSLCILLCLYLSLERVIVTFYVRPSQSFTLIQKVIKSLMSIVGIDIERKKLIAYGLLCATTSAT
jgi:hypothetical protein